MYSLILTNVPVLGYPTLLKTYCTLTWELKTIFKLKAFLRKFVQCEARVLTYIYTVNTLIMHIYCILYKCTGRNVLADFAVCD